jgi:hypothetical protein
MQNNESIHNIPSGQAHGMDINNFDYSKYHLDNNQVVGLVDSDGYFGVWRRTDRNSPMFIFKVSQRDYSKELLMALKAHLKVGNIRLENEKNGTLMFAVGDLNELKEVIIPFFDKYPLVTSKALDYEDWKKAIFL